MLLPPKDILLKLLQERYPDAKTAFWSGSVARGQATATSDLDLVVIFDHVPHAYREAFHYEGWPIDAFIHDMETLRYFFEKVDIPSFEPSLPSMILEGIELPNSTEFGSSLKTWAQDLIHQGPKVTQEALDYKRFGLTDRLDDIKGAKNFHELSASASRFYEELARYYLLAHGQWVGTGKALVRALEGYNPEMAHHFFTAFQDLFQHGHYEQVEQLTKHVLENQGGFLWDGFRSDAPKDWKDRSELDYESDILKTPIMD